MKPAKLRRRTCAILFSLLLFITMVGTPSTEPSSPPQMTLPVRGSSWSELEAESWDPPRSKRGLSPAWALFGVLLLTGTVFVLARHNAVVLRSHVLVKRDGVDSAVIRT